MENEDLIAQKKFIDLLEKLIQEVIYESEHAGESKVKEVKEELVKLLSEENGEE